MLALAAALVGITAQPANADEATVTATLVKDIRPGSASPSAGGLIAPRFTFIAPDGTRVTCRRAVSPVRRVPRR